VVCQLVRTGIVVLILAAELERNTRDVFRPDSEMWKQRGLVSKPRAMVHGEIPNGRKYKITAWATAGSRNSTKNC
jgi:hypothetical protein